MYLSRVVQDLKHNRAFCVQNAHFYEEGEVDRLLARVDQLGHELSLQSMRVEVPYENTAGGFELFNVGITELAPELVGFYGAPGVNPNGPTTLFLVGDGFSVHDTRVIAGGQSADFRLISRQLIEATLPSGLQVINDGDMREAVDVHVASPYGVSAHLLIPLAPSAASLPGGQLAWQANTTWEAFAAYKTGVQAPAFGDYVKVAPDILAFHYPQNAVIKSTKVRLVIHEGQTSVGQCDVAEGKFKYDPHTSQFFLAGDDLNAVWISVKDKLNAYLAYLHSTDRPLANRTLNFVATGYLSDNAGAGDTPIAVSTIRKLASSPSMASRRNATIGTCLCMNRE